MIFVTGPTVTGLTDLCYLFFLPPPHDPGQFSLGHLELLLLLLIAISPHFLGLGGVKLTGKLPLGSDGSFIGFRALRVVEGLLTVVHVQGLLRDFQIGFVEFREVKDGRQPTRNWH